MSCLITPKYFNADLIPENEAAVELFPFEKERIFCAIEIFKLDSLVPLRSFFSPDSHPDEQILGIKFAIPGMAPCKPKLEVEVILYVLPINLSNDKDLDSHRLFS